MGRAVTKGIVAGSVLVAAAMTGVAAANVNDVQPRPTPSEEQTYGDHMGPGRGPMCSVDSEFDYLTRMVPHHREAVAAAEQLRRSRRPEMRRLGATIATTQTAEIAKMRNWLAEWYPGESTAVPYRPMMRDLSKLSGDALDETFLQDMIPHHMAAVMLSQQMLVHGIARHDEVAAFARTVRNTQQDEMFQMRRWLATWFDGRGAPDGSWSGPGPMWGGRDGMCGW